MKLIVTFLAISLVSCGSDSNNNDNNDNGGGNGTTKSSIYVYQTVDGDIVPTSIGDIPTTTARCEADFAQRNPTVTCTTFRALLGYSANNGILNFATNNNIKTNAVVKLLDGREIASSYTSFISNPPPALDGENWFGWPQAIWYSGIKEDGSLGDNCDDWSDAGAAPGPTYGSNVLSSNSKWQAQNHTACNYHSGLSHLCICY